MARYKKQGIFRDAYGNITVGGTATIYLSGTATLANIYSASTGGSPITGSYVTSNVNGYYYFYIDNADYGVEQLFRMVLEKDGFTVGDYDGLAFLPPSCYTTAQIATFNAAATVADLKTALADMLGI